MVEVLAQSDALERTLREVCEQLAPIDTTACSPGERDAAEWIAARPRRAGVDQVALEEEPSWGGAPPTLVALGALGMAGAGELTSGIEGLGHGGPPRW